MVSQAILIGIAVGVFFAGLGVGYAAFQSYNQPNFTMMTPQQMQQMMNDPQMMTQWHQTMMNNPQAMNSWMNTMIQNPQVMQSMMNQMMQNPQFGQWMMGPMMQNPQMMSPWMGNMMIDPQLREQMYSQMMQNNQFMQGMMGNQQFQNQWMGPWMMQNNSTWNGMMGGVMMGPGMMTGQGSASSQALPTNAEPQTRTFDIILDEVEFFAHVENEQGEEETALVELHQWNPNLIVVNKGDTVVLNISNPRKNTHAFTIPEFGIATKILEPRTGSETIQFVADKAGVFTFACGLPYNAANGQCDPDHSMMTGTLIVLE